MLFGKNKGKLTQEQYRRYYSTNLAARDAFIARKQNGLGLSERVWQYTNGFKTEMEMGLDLGIRNGLSADQISRDLRQYLQHPDMLFRRVRDEHGILHLSKRAAAFHPGRGVYRSSYLNARRLAVTETNAAYRTADHERWQNLDFVVGIEIHLSGNHTCKGRDGKQHAFTDICDELAGKYPKDFKFTGWHPHCRCYATTILKTEEEMAADDEKILRGEPVSGESVNEVKDVPEGFKEWMERNQERIEDADSLPYFLVDNKHLIPTTKHGISGKFGHAPTKKEKTASSEHEELHDYSEKQEENFKDISNVTNYQRGEPMTFDEADHGRANIAGDRKNCAACVMVHELRLRGYDITALPYDKDNEYAVSLGNKTQTAWLTKKGKIPELTELKGSEWEITQKIEKVTQVIGSRYHLGWNTSIDEGHIITAVRTKDGLILYCPQRNEYWSLSEIIQEMAPGTKLELLRVDRLLVNTELLNSLTESIV